MRGAFAATDLPPCKHKLMQKLRQINPTSKSVKPVQPLSQKYSASAETQITPITPPVSRQMRDARDRHERAVRCDGRGWRAGRTRLMRTVKSCGPDARGAGIKSRRSESFSGRRWQKSRSPGRARISRKAIAQGRPGCFRRTCMLVCAIFCASCTRDRGCGAHPVFPAPSIQWEGKGDANLGRSAPRERETVSTVIASEAKQSIVTSYTERWIASLRSQ